MVPSLPLTRGPPHSLREAMGISGRRKVALTPGKEPKSGWVGKEMFGPCGLRASEGNWCPVAPQLLRTEWQG